MAKIKAKQVVNIDLSRNENVDYVGKGKVALNFTGADSLDGVNITSDGANLYFYKEEKRGILKLARKTLEGLSRTLLDSTHS